MSESDTATDYVCEECRGDIDPKATTCPHCGYDPAASYRKSAVWRMVFGGLLCLTIIGLLPGIWLLGKARSKNKQAKTASPAVEA